MDLGRVQGFSSVFILHQCVKAVLLAQIGEVFGTQNQDIKN